MYVNQLSKSEEILEVIQAETFNTFWCLKQGILKFKIIISSHWVVFCVCDSMRAICIFWLMLTQSNSTKLLYSDWSLGNQRELTWQGRGGQRISIIPYADIKKFCGAWAGNCPLSVCCPLLTGSGHSEVAGHGGTSVISGFSVETFLRKSCSLAFQAQWWHRDIFLPVKLSVIQ